MKTSFRILILTSIFVISACYPKPEGFIGLKDDEKPKVSITNLQNGETISNAMENFIINVQASDFWGIKKVILECNGYRQTLYYSPYSFVFETEALLDTNYIFAIAYDTSNNTAKTDTISFYMYNTIIVIEPIEEIIMFDNDDPYTVDLDNVFMDIINPSNQLSYEILSNSNETIVEVLLDNNLLTINPQRYHSGIATITIKVSAGDHRSLIYSFNLNIILSEPVIKVYVPDDTFRNLLFNNYGFTQFANEDSIVVEEAESLSKLVLNTNSIYNVEGIQAFVNLDSLIINEPIAELDINNLSEVLYIRLTSTNLDNLNTDDQTNLHELIIDTNCSLEFIDLSNNMNLVRFVNNMNSQLNSIDLSNNESLKSLSMHMTSDNLTSLDLSNNIELERIHITDSHIEEININNCLMLNYLYLCWTDISQLSLGSNVNLEEFYLNNCTLHNINLSNNISLRSLELHNTYLGALDISNNIQLEFVDLRYNEYLIATLVWELPLPDDVTLYKDDHNILYAP